jgi:Ni,Fe-hydrogenase III large subunit
VKIIRALLEIWKNSARDICKPVYRYKLQPERIGISIVEGWRGEICHAAITDRSGKIGHYKVKDPSMHNWMALALAVRNQEISDFPICNKSFNLSYCGNDL